MEVHVLLFPWPLQGHINPMLHLASAFLDAGLHVSLLHTQHNLRRVPPHHPRLRQLSIPDGLPEDHPRSVGHLMELVESMNTVGSAAYRDLLRKETAAEPPSDDNDADRLPPVTCVIADGVMPFAVSVAEDMGVPALAFRPDSACGLLAYLCIPRLLELGEIPVPSDEQVRGVPGMEGLLRRRDLPRVAVAPEGNADAMGADPVPVLLTIADTVARLRDARALVLNTTVSLEGLALPHIARHVRDLFVVGPLHARARPAGATEVEHGGLRRGESENDGGWRAWLDGHKDRSVVYVNLGSLNVVSRQQLAELIHGLAATGYAFLCVIRPDMVHGTTTTLQEAAETAVAAGAGDRALMVEWAVHQDLHYVLRHRAVGCFLTHAGWNSILEVAVEGVPMVCWPYFSDNQIISRFVGAVWKTGLDMKDVCDRAVVERMVREAMESPEIRAAAQAMARQLRMDVAQGGSSSSQLERLIGFITKLSVRAAAVQVPLPSGDDVKN